MSELQALEAQLQASREKFLQAVEDLRPALHKYCARMTGSLLDGEDLVWAGVKQLLTVDTQCDVVGAFSGRGRDTIAGNYLRTYDGLWPWKMTRAWVDGEEIMACWHEVAGRWQLRGIARIEWADSTVEHIRDYTHVPYLLSELDLADQEPAGND